MVILNGFMYILWGDTVRGVRAVSAGVVHRACACSWVMEREGCVAPGRRWRASCGCETPAPQPTPHQHDRGHEDDEAQDPAGDQPGLAQAASVLQDTVRRQQGTDKVSGLAAD